MPGPLTPDIMAILPQWMARQRWYAGKGRTPVLTRIGGIGLEDPAGEADIDIHLLLDESGRMPTTYQVPLTCRAARLTGGDHALVATLQAGGDGGEGARYLYDGPHDPAFATALLRLILEEKTATFDREQSPLREQSPHREQSPDREQPADRDHGPESGQGCGADGHRLAKTDPGELRDSRVLTGEQSNTSIIIDLADALGNPLKPLICKVFRVLHHGQNPDVVVQSALSAAGSTRVPDSIGYVSGRWPDEQASAGHGIATGHLAYAQEFLPGVQDAWRVALAAVATGEDFSTQARSLGQRRGPRDARPVHGHPRGNAAGCRGTDPEHAFPPRRGAFRGARHGRARPDGPRVHRSDLVCQMARPATDPRRLSSGPGA